MIFVKNKPHLVKIRWVNRTSPCFFKHLRPIFFQFFKESSNTASGLRALASNNVLCLSIMFMPRCASLRALGNGYLTKGIESSNDCIEHDNKMLVSIKVLYI